MLFDFPVSIHLLQNMLLYCTLLMQETLETRVEDQERRIKHYQEKVEQILEEKDQIQVNEGYTFT